MEKPPIRCFTDFIPHADALFARLSAEVEWDQRMRARKTASFGVAYDYSGITYPELPMPPVLQEIAQQIAATLGFMPNNCLLNYYPDGNAAMGFHSDSSAELAPGTGVAIVSLGAQREMVFRWKADRSQETVCPLVPGSLLYMSKEMQADWLHAILREEGCGARISLTFRQIIKTALE